MFCAHRHQVLTINEPVNQVVAPLNGVSVEFLAGRTDVDVHAGLLIQRPLETVVCCQKNSFAGSTGIHHFHDVEFTTASPRAIGCVSGQHPDGGP